VRTVIVVVLLLVAVGVGLGFYLDWFRFTGERNSEDGKTTLGVEVNKDKIKGDVNSAQEKAKEFGQTVKEKFGAGTETAKGEVITVQGTDRRFTLVTPDKKELTIQVEPASKIRSQDRDIQLEGVQKGDQVQVIYRVKDGKNIAQSVTVEPATR